MSFQIQFVCEIHKWTHRAKRSNWSVGTRERPLVLRKLTRFPWNTIDTHMSVYQCVPRDDEQSYTSIEVPNSHRSSQSSALRKIKASEFSWWTSKWWTKPQNIIFVLKKAKLCEEQRFHRFDVFTAPFSSAPWWYAALCEQWPLAAAPGFYAAASWKRARNSEFHVTVASGREKFSVLTSWLQFPAGRPELWHHIWWSLLPPAGRYTLLHKQLQFRISSFHQGKNNIIIILNKIEAHLQTRHLQFSLQAEAF